MPDVLLFDFGGTLDAGGLTWKERFQALCEVSDRDFYAADDALVGTIPKTAGLHDTLQRLGLPFERFEADAIAHLRESAKILRQLRKRYRIGIVSNFYGNLEAACREHGIDADVYIDSVDVGCMKPDPKIFFAALHALGAEPRDAVFIGDSPHRDMAGARAIGMPHILLTPNRDAIGCCPGDRVIHRLSELGVAGGIIAAGDGSRLRSAGVPKPLVPVNGVPLIERVIRNFDAAGIERLVVVFNEREEDCRDFVRERFPNVEVILKTTRSSAETFRLVLDALGERAVVSTVDAVCKPDDFVRFVRAADARPDAALLALTPFVDDEKPLWCTVAGDGRITTIGGSSGDAVTAGIYAMPASMAIDGEFERLRDLLAALVRSGAPVYGETVGKVIDVDRPEDVLVAERSL